MELKWNASEESHLRIIPYRLFFNLPLQQDPNHLFTAMHRWITNRERISYNLTMSAQGSSLLQRSPNTLRHSTTTDYHRHVEMRELGHVLCKPLSHHVTYLYAGTGDLRTPYLQCAAESCTFCSPSSRHPALWEAGAVWPGDRPPCRRCERSSSRLCFSVPGLRRGTAAPGSRQGFSECRPSSEESWAGGEQVKSSKVGSHIKSYHTVRFFKYSKYMR